MQLLLDAVHCSSIGKKEEFCSTNAAHFCYNLMINLAFCFGKMLTPMLMLYAICSYEMPSIGLEVQMGWWFRRLSHNIHVQDFKSIQFKFISFIIYLFIMYR